MSKPRDEKKEITKMKKILITLAMVMFLAGSVFAAGQPYSAWKDADEGVAFMVRYMGTDTATMAVTTNGLSVLDNTASNFVSFRTGTLTLSDIYANVTACTNVAAAAKNFECVLMSGLTTTALTNSYFISASPITMARKTWYPVKWDTSVVKEYYLDLSIPTDNTLDSPKRITKIVGSPTGTGDVTLEVYSGDDRRFMKVIESPYYTVPLYSYLDTVTTNTTVATINLGEDVSIEAKSGQRLWVRATRATTATTGGIGVVGEKN